MGRVNVFFIKGNTLEMLSGAKTGFTLEFWPLWDKSSLRRITELITHFDNETKQKSDNETNTKNNLILSPK